MGVSAMSAARAGRSPRAPGVQRHLVGYGLVVVVGLLLAVVARFTAPRPLAIALAVLFILIAAWFVEPFVGLCGTVLLALIGDIDTSPWYPFTKGMSAHESIMFIHQKIIISPLELCVVVGFIAVMVRYLVDGSWLLRMGPASRVVAVFGFFVVVGFFYGVGTGGSTYVALLEVRPFVAFIGMYFLAIGICRTRTHYRHLLWSVLAAIEIHAVIALLHVSRVSAERLKNTESLLDHGAVMRMDVLFLTLISAWMLKGNSLRMRLTTTAMAMPVAVIYMIAERRAAIIALVVSLGFLAVVLFWKQRRTFFKVVPISTIILIGYVGAFWNSQSGAGFPAQAVKSVISPDQVNQRNQSSDLYRQAESFDLNYTIRQSKLTGLGLGKAFYRPLSLPSLSNFVLSDYIPHNSILWVWVSFGFGGFVAMFCLIGRTVMLGAHAIRETAVGRDLTVLLAFVLGVVVFTIFAAVDIAWDAGNLVLLGVCTAAATNYPVATPPVVVSSDARSDVSAGSALADTRR